MDLTIDLAGVAALANRMEGAAGVIEPELKAGMSRLVLQGQAFAMEATPAWTGTARRNWHTTASAREGTIANNTPYIRPLNDGRRAGAPMPPAGALLAWMASKGIPAEAEFAVRRAIGRRGIPPRRMKEQTVERLRPLAEQEARAMAQRIAAKLRG